MAFLNTVFLSSHYPPEGQYLNITKKIRANSYEPIIFDLSQIENTDGSQNTIYKTIFEFGDGTKIIKTPTFNFNTNLFETVSSIQHTYNSNLSTLSDSFTGRFEFFYRNGVSTVFLLDIYYTEPNIIELKPSIFNSSSFTESKSANNLINFTNNNKNKFYSKISNNKGFSSKQSNDLVILNSEKKINTDTQIQGTNIILTELQN